MSCQSRERQKAIEAKRNPKPWELERDEELDDLEFPAPDYEPEPIHTNH
ncbi:hypothetical protein C8C99_0261 [Acidovorax sp. 107]|nr:hypothetical protein [Acidovorax sp. 107]PUA95461.1 hypothetical protein C8C99_0261 [Acidovorax sp. 107]